VDYVTEEAFMSRFLNGALVALMAVPFAFGQPDRPGSKDYPGISRMPGYYIDSYSQSQFDSFSFQVTEAGKRNDQAVEGHLYKFRYAPKKDASLTTSALQILRNYQNAARAAGGQVLYEDGRGDDRETTIRLTKGATDAWLAIVTRNPAPSSYYVTIVEKEAMQQDVTVDAKAMAQDIGETGRVAVYGIHFDTGKAELKPDSEPALVEIAKLLTQNLALKIYVVGHTDMVADPATNVKLSQARAQAVVNALASQHGIASARLIAYGDGPYAPVASNKTEDGRARNRRVELVEIATK